MSELVIRAPAVRLLVPRRMVTVTIDPPSTTEAAPVVERAAAARSWHLPEQDDDLGTHAAMGRVSGWFMPQG
jgi:hypothetical protein